MGQSWGKGLQRDLRDSIVFMFDPANDRSLPDKPTDYTQSVFYRDIGSGEGHGTLRSGSYTSLNRGVMQLSANSSSYFELNDNLYVSGSWTYSFWIKWGTEPQGWAEYTQRGSTTLVTAANGTFYIYYTLAPITDNPSELTFDNDGNIYVVGGFTEYDNNESYHVVKLDATGSYVSSFTSPNVNSIGGVTNRSSVAFHPISESLYMAGTNVGCDKVDKDTGTILLDVHSNIGGNNDIQTKVILDVDRDKLYFTGRHTTPSVRISRVNLSDHSHDTTFNPGAGPSGADPDHLALRKSDGGLWFADFSSVTYSGSASSSYLWAINPDGTIDETVKLGSFNASVRDIYEQDDGKLLVCGNFTTYSGSSVPKAVRLNPDGTIDSDFTPYFGSNAYDLYVIREDSSGSIWIGGEQGINGGLMKTDASGSEDTGFAGSIASTFITTQFAIYITDMQEDANGKMVLIGTFDTYSGSYENRIVRINKDGTIDSTFNQGDGINDGMYRFNAFTGVQNAGGTWSSNAHYPFGGGRWHREHWFEDGIMLDGKWHHMALTLDIGSQTLRWYRDGTQIGTDSYTGYQNTDFNMKQFLKAGSQENLTIGQVIVYDRDLSSTEINEYIERTKRKYGRS